MTRENDYKTAAAVVERWKSIDCRADRIQLTLGAITNLEIKIADALTTVRKKAREAAFRDAFKIQCPDCAEGDQPVYDQEARWYYHGELHETVGCSASKLRIEAAANTEEGAGDG